MNLREWLARGENELTTGPHPERARRDAETLLLHLIGKNRAWLLGHLGDSFSGCRAIGYANLLSRRVAGEPIQYILGECEFYGMPFRVTPDVLIPRPETEHIVERVLDLASALEAPRIADVGTGSGAIAVALAHQLRGACVAAIDLSERALAIAQENARRNQVAGQIHFVQGDLLEAVIGEVFDVIVSNPPYVPIGDRASLSVEVREHEPALALFGGQDGLDIYRRLIPQACGVLAENGFVALEIGFGQADAIRGLLQSAGFAQIACAPDLQGIPRVITARRVQSL
jgi:release factor glutamine methyltransferase